MQAGGKMLQDIVEAARSHIKGISTTGVKRAVHQSQFAKKSGSRDTEYIIDGQAATKRLGK